MIPTIQGEFRLVDDPELRFTPQGVAVCNVRLVAQNRKKEGEEWVDDPDKILWISGSVWRQYAENVAESLRKGDLVFVVGKIRTRDYETSEGEKRTVTELLIDEIGPTLRFRAVLHTDASGHKVTREGAAAAPSADDPWAHPAGQPNVADEPPF